MASSPLRRPAFQRLIAARAAVVFGNAIAPIALAFAVLDLTGSAADLGLVVASRSAANVVVLLAGGVLADRLPRNFILVGSSLIAGLVQSAAAASLSTGHASVALLAALGVLNGLAAGLAAPASSALVPLTVPRYLLRPANAMSRLVINIGTIAGAGAGALLIAALGPPIGILIDAATFLIGAALFALIKLRPQPVTDSDPNAARPSVLRDLATGWREFVSRRWVWVVVAAFCVINAAFSGAITILGPTIADATFGRAAWGLVLAAETAGFIAGGVLALRWRPRHALAIGVALTAVTAIPVLTLAALPLVVPLVIAFFIGGIAVEQFAVAWDQSIQTHIPPDRLARVYSYDALGSFAAIPVGQALIGPLATLSSPSTALTICSAAILLASAAALSQTSVRTLRTST